MMWGLYLPRPALPPTNGQFILDGKTKYYFNRKNTCVKRKDQKYLQKEKLSVTAVILMLVLLAYGLLIPWMGFYWDDWPFAWVLRFFSPAEFIKSFRTFRPFLRPIFQLTTARFGGGALTWQVIELITRFLLSL
ncbi:MAG: hypothetical protein Q8L41_15765 [Anaerolineales bacterium]|nr:hypothetical protein [Anaerolineales bacterium]MDP2778434.1 hypothetical protein [Anaerolineales bacterium]